MSEHTVPPVHPGEYLMEEFLQPLGMGEIDLAKALHVPPGRVHDLILGKRAITLDTALRLSRYFGTTAQFWINMQTHYDLECAHDDRLIEKIEQEVTPRGWAAP